jgi:replication factor C subunit 1
MPSILRDELKDLIEKYGGRMTLSLSGKTDVLVRGCEEVGPKKLEEAKQRKIIICDQEGLFAVIAGSLTPTAPPPKPAEVEVAPSEAAGALFADKYAPTSLEEFVGNVGPLALLRKWLCDFPRVEKRMALVSGPTGVGKTTGVLLLCRDLGLSMNVFDASDCRSKVALDRLAPMVDSLTFAAEGMRKTVVVFDEVDGLSPGERGGIPAIAALGRAARVPVICICREIVQRLEPIVSASISIGFVRPAKMRADLVRRLLSICRFEKIDAQEDAIVRLVQLADFDVRYCLNALQFWNTSSPAGPAKDTEIPDVVSATLAIYGEGTIDSKIDAFFVDSRQVPFYLEENLPVTDRHILASQLDAIALGDTIDCAIRTYDSWELMSAHAVVSCLIPASLNEVPVQALLVPKGARVASRQQKLARYVSEIGRRTARSCGVPRGDIYDGVAEALAWKLKGFLTDKANDAQGLVNALETLGLTADDVDHVTELCSFEKGWGPQESEAVRKKFATIYKSKHSDNQKTIGLEGDVRADFMFAKTADWKKRRSR